MIVVEGKCVENGARHHQHHPNRMYKEGRERTTERTNLMKQSTERSKGRQMITIITRSTAVNSVVVVVVVVGGCNGDDDDDEHEIGDWMLEWRLWFGRDTPKFRDRGNERTSKQASSAHQYQHQYEYQINEIGDMCALAMPVHCRPTNQPTNQQGSAGHENGSQEWHSTIVQSIWRL